MKHSAIYIEPNAGIERNAGGRTEWFATGILYAAFIATGLGIGLPGALLPLLPARSLLSDQQAGLFFFLFFIGSTSGALLSRGSLPRSIARGCVAAALGASLLGVDAHVTAFVAVTLYGLGLGVVMTSVSVLVSRRHAADRAAHITRLNLIWALGACFGPWIALRGTASWGAPRMLYAVAGLFLVLGALAWGFVKHVEAEAVSTTGWWRQARSVPIALLLMVPLATGIESAAGGWLSTYSNRSGHTLNVTIGAATFLWIGLLLSRLVTSNRRVASSWATRLLRLGPWLMAAALALLVASSGGAPTLLAALLLGLGVGPMYPSVLASVLHRGEGGNAVFVVAGVGAAVLPLLTGLVSGWTGSLRLGLGVPLLGALSMAFCGWWVTRRSNL